MMNREHIHAAKRKTDTLLVTIVFICGFAIGAAHLLQGQVTFFYQMHLPSVVMKACGWGWVTPETFIEPMWDF